MYIVEVLLVNEPATDQRGALTGKMTIIGDSNKTQMDYLIPNREGKIISADLGGLEDVWETKSFDTLKSRLHKGMKVQFRISPRDDIVAQKGLSSLLSTEIVNPQVFTFVPDAVGIY